MKMIGDKKHAKKYVTSIIFSRVSDMGDPMGPGRWARGTWGDGPSAHDPMGRWAFGPWSHGPMGHRPMGLRTNVLTTF